MGTGTLVPCPVAAENIDKIPDCMIKNHIDYGKSPKSVERVEPFIRHSAGFFFKLFHIITAVSSASPFSKEPLIKSQYTL